MSTYTCLHHNLKENIAVIHRPGCEEDGMTPQLVKFMNPESEFHGILFGEISCQSGGLLNKVKITNAEISGATLIKSSVNGLDLDDLYTRFGTLTDKYEQEFPASVLNLIETDEKLKACLDRLIIFCANDLSGNDNYLSNLISATLISVININANVNTILTSDLVFMQNEISALSIELMPLISNELTNTINVVSSNLTNSFNTKLQREITNNVHYKYELIYAELGSVYLVKDFSINIVKPLVAIKSIRSNDSASENDYIGQVSYATASVNAIGAKTAILSIGVNFYSTKYPFLSSYVLPAAVPVAIGNDYYLQWIPDDDVSITDLSMLNNDTISLLDSNKTEIEKFNIDDVNPNYNVFIKIPNQLDDNYMREFIVKFVVESKNPGTLNTITVMLLDAIDNVNKEIKYEWHGEPVLDNKMEVFVGKVTTVKFMEIRKNVFSILDVDNSMLWDMVELNSNEISLLTNCIALLTSRIAQLENALTP